MRFFETTKLCAIIAEYLDLARNDLTGRIPSELGRFYHLSKCKTRKFAICFMNGNVFNKYFLSFFLCPDTETLNLTKNDLTGSIPSELKSLFKLGKLIYIYHVFHKSIICCESLISSHIFFMFSIIINANTLYLRNFEFER